MIVYILVIALLILSLLVVFFGIKSNDKAVRAILAFVSALPWIILIIFLKAFKVS